jgi:hypothetical protein
MPYLVSCHKVVSKDRFGDCCKRVPNVSDDILYLLITNYKTALKLIHLEMFHLLKKNFWSSRAPCRWFLLLSRFGTPPSLVELVYHILLLKNLILLSSKLFILYIDTCMVILLQIYLVCTKFLF